MPLRPPVLDDRTFDELVAEARARIPRYTPEWTNLNDADPGMTLVKLHAWLTETILYRLNQLPELNYLKFLELLNVRPHPAVAATAELSFTLRQLSELDDPLELLIPQGTQVAVDDPDLDDELIFETDRTLRAVNATLGVILAPRPGEFPLEPVTEFDEDERRATPSRAFHPFGPDPATRGTLFVGLLLRPHRKPNLDYSLDRFPEGELDLTAFVPEVFEEDASGTRIDGPEALECLFPRQRQTQGDRVVWEAYVGTEHAAHFSDDRHWQRLGVHDETAGLTRSGHLYLEVPGGLTGVPFDALRPTFWETLNLRKPPTTKEELVTALQGGELAPNDLDKATWETLGITDPPCDDLAALLARIAEATLDFEAVPRDTWLDLGFHEAPVPESDLTWLRARLADAGTPETMPQLNDLRLNTVAATAAVTRLEEVLEESEGRPGHQRTLRRSPVLIDPASGRPDLRLEVEEEDGFREWQAVDNFYGEGPEARVFRFDSATATLTFGDGEHGRIPTAKAQIVARRYRYGGGRIGNVGPGTITALRSSLPEVDGVTNARAAAGGADAEPLTEVKLRAPHDLRTRDRAVTAEDFAELARQTPGVRIQRAYAVPLTTQAGLAETPPNLGTSPGAVTVVVVPESATETPEPSEAQLRLICAHLNQRRLITTELYVTGPRYLKLARLEVEVAVAPQRDLKAVRDEVSQRLQDYLHPLRGGNDGRGWPFGHDIHLAHLYQQALSVPGVIQVLCLELETEGDAGTERCTDVLSVPPGQLVHLPRDVLDVKVRYDERR